MTEVNSGRPARDERPGGRRLRSARMLLVSGTTLIVALQIVALPVRNPVTRTMSSYEYTWAGWLFPIGLWLFGAGLGMLCRLVPSRHPVVRASFLAAALGAAATATFPSGTGRPGEALWPGEIHRWGSIALVVCALTGAVLLARGVLGRRSARTIGRMTVSAGAAGVLFMTGQLAPAPEGVLGYAPLAGGLSQRILIGLTVAAMLHLVAMLAAATSTETGPGEPGTGTGPGRSGTVISTGRGRTPGNPPTDPAAVHD